MWRSRRLLHISPDPTIYPLSAHPCVTLIVSPIAPEGIRLIKLFTDTRVSSVLIWRESVFASAAVAIGAANEVPAQRTQPLEFGSGPGKSSIKTPRTPLLGS